MLPRAKTACCRRGALLCSHRKVCPTRGALFSGAQAPHEPRTARPRTRAEDVHVRRLVGRALLLRYVHILPHPRRRHLRPPAPLLHRGPPALVQVPLPPPGGRPSSGSCASSGRASRRWLARYCKGRRPCHWAPNHCLGCLRQRPLRSPVPSRSTVAISMMPQCHTVAC